MHFGNTMHIMIVPPGSSRSVYYSAGVRDSVVSLVRSSSEFSFLTSVRQMRHNSGSLLSLRTSDSRQMLEIQSSGRQDVLRLLYMTRAGLRVETFPLRLADDSWHRLAVIVSGDQIEVSSRDAGCNLTRMVTLGVYRCCWTADLSTDEWSPDQTPASSQTRGSSLPGWARGTRIISFLR